MIERAIFLRKAVDIFTRSNEADLNKYILSSKEWGQAEILLSILLPFKIVSNHLETELATGHAKNSERARNGMGTVPLFLF